MMNYTKSEFYRIFITKEIYAAAGLPRKFMLRQVYWRELLCC